MTIKRSTSGWKGAAGHDGDRLREIPALRLAKFFGNSPEFWRNLQQAHELSKGAFASGARHKFVTSSDRSWGV